MGPVVRHGRRSGRKSDHNTQATNSALQTDTVFKLALNPPNDPEAFKLSTQMVASEYATRYLEQIGVKPSKSTLDMVHKSIPLTESCVKTTFRAKGHVSDEVQITVPPVHHVIKVSHAITAHSVAQLGMTNQEAVEQQRGMRPQEAVAGPTQKQVSSVGSSLPPDEKPGPGSTFKRLASRYLHPFNLDTNLAKQNLERIRSMAAGQQQQLPQENSTSNLAASDDLLDDESLRRVVQEELAQELVVTEELVLTVLAPLESALIDWFKAQAPESLKDRLTREEFMDAVAMFSDESIIRFFATTINFLHIEFVESSPHFEAEAAKVASQQNVIDRQSMVPSKGKKSGSFNTSRTMALQQLDLGYRMFVEERLSSMQAQRAQQMQPRHTLLQQAGTLRTPLPSMMEPQHAAAARGPSGQPLSSVQFPETGARALSSAQDREPRPTLASRSRVSFAAGMQGLDGGVSTSHSEPHAASRPISADEPVTPSGHDCDTMQLLPGSPLAVRKSLRHLPSARHMSATTVARAIMESLGPRDMAHVQQTRLFVLQKEFAAMYKKQRQQRAGMFFCLPIFLLFLRLAVSMLFSSLYSLWCRTKDGMDTLERMDATLVHLFDPHGYLQRNLTLIQSSPAAITILTKYPHKGHEAEHIHFKDTSPLLRAALSEPSSAAARRLMLPARNATKQAPIKTKLTKAQMEALYEDARAMMATQDANLGKVGEPAQPTTRDSWIPKPY